MFICQKVLQLKGKDQSKEAWLRQLSGVQPGTGGRTGEFCDPVGFSSMCHLGRLQDSELQNPHL